MSLNQTLYFMSLAGAMAGLLSWALVSLMLWPVELGDRRWVADFAAAAVLGGFLGGMTVGFGDHWSGNRASLRWIVSGSLIGAFAGAIAGAVQIPISSAMAEQRPILSRVLSWVCAGSFIGFGLGLRWISVNRARAIHALLGGIAGGAIGGFLFGGFGSRIPDLSQATSFVLTGAGISLGITLAPILMRDAVLQFVSSGDARAQNKFGRTRKQWELQDGDSCVIGSESRDATQTRYRPAVQIYIPDASIAPEHARLYARDGRFFIARHPGISNQAGLARYILRVRGKTVAGSQELRDSDDILIGRTALMFMARRRAEQQ